jgi:hypothetical protein
MKWRLENQLAKANGEISKASMAKGNGVMALEIMKTAKMAKIRNNRKWRNEMSYVCGEMISRKHG